MTLTLLHLTVSNSYCTYLQRSVECRSVVAVLAGATLEQVTEFLFDHLAGESARFRVERVEQAKAEDNLLGGGQAQETAQLAEED